MRCSCSMFVRDTKYTPFSSMDIHLFICLNFLFFFIFFCWYFFVRFIFFFTFFVFILRFLMKHNKWCVFFFFFLQFFYFAIWFVVCFADCTVFGYKQKSREKSMGLVSYEVLLWAFECGVCVCLWVCWAKGSLNVRNLYFFME